MAGTRQFSIIAFIPARSGSVRVPGKNVRLLAGHPLFAWTVRAAIDSGIFSRVLLCSDSAEYNQLGDKYGAEGTWRPYADPLDSDIEWLQHVWAHDVKKKDQHYDCYAILRPTSPFRTAYSIRTAWGYFQAVADDGGLDSLRTMDRGPHPMKSWRPVDGTRFVAPWIPTEFCAHNCQTAGLPIAYQQNGAMEIAWTKNIEAGNMSGERVVPWFLPCYEGHDINTEADWMLAEALLERGKVTLPEMEDK